MRNKFEKKKMEILRPVRNRNKQTNALLREFFFLFVSFKSSSPFFNLFSVVEWQIEYNLVVWVLSNGRTKTVINNKNGKFDGVHLLLEPFAADFPREIWKNFVWICSSPLRPPPFFNSLVEFFHFGFRSMFVAFDIVSKK